MFRAEISRKAMVCHQSSFCKLNLGRVNRKDAKCAKVLLMNTKNSAPLRFFLALGNKPGLWLKNLIDELTGDC